VRDIDLTSNAVWVIAGKGKKDGVVSITPDCAKILMSYLEEYPRYNDSPLFTTLRFNNLYQTGDLRKLLRVVAKRAKINKRVYPHLLRHSLATNLLNRGANIFMVQHQLRHSFIETTMVYLKANTARLNSEYQFYAPSYC
jgi:integrase/recombinase XerD